MRELEANVARYYFKAVNLPDDAFQVVHFTGVEEVSQPFRYEVHLVSEDPNIDFAGVVNQPATLVLMRGVEEVPLQGVVSHLEQAGRTKDHVVYRVVLVPHLWLLSLTYQSRIFQNQAVRDIVEQVLQEAGLSGAGFRFDLSGSYAPREYCVQYQETDLNFVSRLLEHEGICYYFEHDDQREVLVMTDDRTSHPSIPDDQLIYNEEAGMVQQGTEFISELVCQERVVTGQVTEADYNWRTPETKVQGASQLNGDMPGEFYEFGEHLKDSGQAGQLATVRNEELECVRRVVRGQSNCPALRAGQKFTLKQHYRDDLNEEYLITRVRHQGSQRRALGLAGVDSRNGSDADQEYVNQFECIPARVQYRPPRTAPVPKLPGLMTAKVDSAGGDYAYIDEDGSYRAIMPFDRSGTSGGNATLPIRMAQPYSGPDYGMHFPLHQNTEIVWGCIDGDVDRPVALGTVPNPTNTSPATSANKQQNVIRTWGQNELTFDDTKGSENIYLFATKDRNTEVTHDHNETVGNNQTISVGTNRDKSVGVDQTETVGANKTINVGGDHTETISGSMTQTVVVGKVENVGAAKSLLIGAAYQVTVGGVMNETVAGAKTEEVGAFKGETVAGGKTEKVGGNRQLNVGKSASVSIQEDRTVKVSKDDKEEIGGKQTVKVAKEYVLSAKKIQLQAADEITFKTGKAEITMKKNGDIIIKGKKVQVKGSGDVVIKGSKIKEN